MGILFFGIFAYKNLFATVKEIKPNMLQVKLDHLEANTVTYFAKYNLFIVHNIEQVMALDEAHPHGPNPGCPVQWIPEEERFRDPCLGTTFNRFGKHLGGPSPGDLHQFPVRKENGTVIIHLD